MCQRTRETSNQKQRSISSQEIVDVFILKDLIIPFGSRACNRHFNTDGHLDDEALRSLNKYSDSTRLSEQEYSQLLQLTRQKAL